MGLSKALGHLSSWPPAGHSWLLMCLLESHWESRALGAAPSPPRTSAERGARHAHHQTGHVLRAARQDLPPALCTIHWGRRETPSRSQKAPGFQWRSSPTTVTRFSPWTPSLFSLRKDKDVVNHNEMNRNTVGRALHRPSRRHSLIHMSTGLEGLGRVMAWKSSGPVIQILNCHLNTHVTSVSPSVWPGSVSSEAERWKVPQAASSPFLLPFLPKTFTSWRGQESGEEGEQ